MRTKPKQRESLQSWMKRLKRLPKFKPGVVVCDVTGDVSAMWEDAAHYGDSRIPEFCLYRAFDNGRIIGLRIYMPPPWAPKAKKKHP